METVVNKISYASIAMASLTLLYLLFVQTSQPCLSRFPKSSCEAWSRSNTTFQKLNHRLWSTRSWQTQVSSYAQFFGQALVRNDSKVLCVSAGPGHVAAALASLGVRHVTAIEIVPSPPLVVRADPLNLPFLDGVFDLAFSAHVAEALYPDRVAAEMERAVRPGGACVVAVEECGGYEVAAFAGLFGRSEFVEAVNVSLGGSRVTRIVLRKNIKIVT